MALSITAALQRRCNLQALRKLRQAALWTVHGFPVFVRYVCLFLEFSSCGWGMVTLKRLLCIAAGVCFLFSMLLLLFTLQRHIYKVSAGIRAAHSIKGARMAVCPPMKWRCRCLELWAAYRCICVCSLAGSPRFTYPCFSTRPFQPGLCSFHYAISGRGSARLWYFAQHMRRIHFGGDMRRLQSHPSSASAILLQEFTS
jgi:hypothetical protein